MSCLRPCCIVHRSWLHCYPGGGVKGKINPAVAHGVRILAYDIAVEAMKATTRRSVLLAKSPANFAKKAARLYTDCEVWSCLSQGGPRLLEKQLSDKAA